MENTDRLIFINDKSPDELNELWHNCFDGNENDDHMHRHIPNQFRVPNQASLYNFLTNNNSTWLVKRIVEKDIIGFAVFGDFMPGMENNIGFNIGLKYINNGYGSELLNALIEIPRKKGLVETFGHCLESNIGSIKTMEKCGFTLAMNTGRQFNGNKELKFKKLL
jgi:RimJ/RimL family protein N-acetyltransferase